MACGINERTRLVDGLPWDPDKDLRASLSLFYHVLHLYWLIYYDEVFMCLIQQTLETTLKFWLIRGENILQ